MNKNIVLYALGHAVLMAAYVALIALTMANAETLFGPVDPPLAPMGFLLLLVVSAAIAGLLVFARPIVWYLDGKKKEAVRLVIWTVGFLALMTVLVFIYFILQAQGLIG